MCHALRVDRSSGLHRSGADAKSPCHWSFAQRPLERARPAVFDFASSRLAWARHGDCRVHSLPSDVTVSLSPFGPAFVTWIGDSGGVASGPGQTVGDFPVRAWIPVKSFGGKVERRAYGADTGRLVRPG